MYFRSGMKITINGEDAKREIQGVSNEMPKIRYQKSLKMQKQQYQIGVVILKQL